MVSPRVAVKSCSVDYCSTLGETVDVSFTPGSCAVVVVAVVLCTVLVHRE